MVKAITMAKLKFAKELFMKKNFGDKGTKKYWGRKFNASPMSQRAIYKAISGLLLMVAVLTINGCDYQKKSEPEKALSARRTYLCPRRENPIIIDGKIDKMEWQNALVIRDFNIAGGAAVKSPTTCWMLWDSENLYFAAEMKDEDVYACKKNHDDRLWEEDVIELFLKPREDSPHYYEFEINALGQTLDLMYPRRGSGYGTFDRWKLFESGIRAAAVIDGTLNNWEDRDQCWTVEAAIPMQAFQKTTKVPVPGDRWLFTFARYDYSVYLEKPELSHSAPLTKLSFDHYEDYDWLEFQ